MIGETCVSEFTADSTVLTHGETRGMYELCRQWDVLSPIREDDILTGFVTVLGRRFDLQSDVESPFI